MLRKRICPSHKEMSQSIKVKSLMILLIKVYFITFIRVITLAFDGHGDLHLVDPVTVPMFSACVFLFRASPVFLDDRFPRLGRSTQTPQAKTKTRFMLIVNTTRQVTITA